MFGDDHAILSDQDTLGIGLYLMCHLQDHRRVVEANGLMAPVELLGFTGFK